MRRMQSAIPRIPVIASAAVGLLMFAVLAAVRGLSPETAELAVFAGILTYLSFIDVDERRIPNGCIIAAIVVRFAYFALALAFGWMQLGEIGYYVLSAIAIGAVLFAVAIVAERVFGGESIGGGDLKLYAVAGLFFGWQLGIVAIALSCVLGIMAAIVLTRGNRGASGLEKGLFKRAMPFGPFIAVACAAVMIFGNILPV